MYINPFLEAFQTEVWSFRMNNRISDTDPGYLKYELNEIEEVLISIFILFKSEDHNLFFI